MQTIMTLITNILAGFGLACLIAFTGLGALFISASIKLDREIKADRAKMAARTPPVRRSKAEQEAEAIILHLL